MISAPNNTLVSKLFVSVSHTECDVSSNKSSDLRLMGTVLQKEYECFALFVENNFGQLPEFNDKKNLQRNKSDLLRFTLTRNSLAPLIFSRSPF
jgi:hypothetical protein